MSDDLTVTVEDVTVRKAFDADSFPVPAIAFEIESSREEAVDLALVDDIPESFPMDHVGFHPDYESENWTAFQDHRVQYERTLDPDEAVTTVYGIRIDDPEEAGAFLDEPDLQVRQTGAGEASATDGIQGVEAATTDVVPSESTDLVREAIAGDRETVPGLEDEDGDGAEATTSEADADEPAIPEYDPVGDELDAAEGPADESADAESEGTADADEPAVVAGEDDAEVEEPADAPEPTVAEGEEGAVPGADDEPGGEPAVDLDSEPSVDLDPEPEWSEGPDDGDAVPSDEPAVEPVAGGDADSSEHGDGTDAGTDEPSGTTAAPVEGPDAALPEGSLVEALAAELRDGDASEEDLATLADALGDAQASGSTEARIDHLQARVSDLEAYADALEAFIDENGTARAVLEDLRDSVDALESRTDDVETAQTGAEEARNRLRSDVDDLADGLDAVDDLSEDIDALGEDVAHLDDRLDEVADLDEDLADVRDDVADLREDIRSLREWRDQLTDVLGG